MRGPASSGASVSEIADFEYPCMAVAERKTRQTTSAVHTCDKYLCIHNRDQHDWLKKLEAVSIRSTRCAYESREDEYIYERYHILQGVSGGRSRRRRRATWRRCEVEHESTSPTGSVWKSGVTNAAYTAFGTVFSLSSHCHRQGTGHVRTF